VSSGKVVDYLSHVFPNAKKAINPVRIWLMSCHSASDDLEDANQVYGKSFAEKLSVKGWRNARVVGFEGPVNHWDTLPKVRELASKTPLYSSLNFPATVDDLTPKIWGIDAGGTVSNKR
jgi:hypothetical protein